MALEQIMRPTLSHKDSDPVDRACTNLAVEVLSFAVQETGSEYLTTEDGEWWLGLIGLDGNAIQTRLLHRVRNAELQEVV